ncbi:MAG: cyclic nucleotide-binding domain-containing protein [Elusimicrobiota bacterium]|jgi:CRP-like cAMP-binding protein
MTAPGYSRLPVTQSHIDWLGQLGCFGDHLGNDPKRMCIDLSSMELLQFPAGLAIIQEREMTDCLYILFEGSAEISRGGARLATVTSGAILGELGFIIRRESAATVTASEACKVFRLGRLLLLDLQQKYPGFVPALLRFAKKHLVAA